MRFLWTVFINDRAYRWEQLDPVDASLAFLGGALLAAMWLVVVPLGIMIFVFLKVMRRLDSRKQAREVRRDSPRSAEYRTWGP
jgi:hypothetical protein